MLNSHLLAKVDPICKKGNTIYWKDYRISVLTNQLFRIEKCSSLIFRDRASQSVWFRNTKINQFKLVEKSEELQIKTDKVVLLLRLSIEDSMIDCGLGFVKINNKENLLGTYRTLDNCNGNLFMKDPWKDKGEPISLGMGVCSKNGVAVIDDSKSLSLNEEGRVIDEKSEGLDLYVFAYGHDYEGAVKALYTICGSTPMLPRYALGNWWSRYHAYTDREYLGLLNTFAEKKVPFSVATIDMDWHWSTDVVEKMKIKEQGLMDEEYTGYPIDKESEIGWSGYGWNTELFPDYKKFLQEIHRKNYHIAVNLHPAGGVRFWDDCYDDMAKALNIDPNSKRHIKFNFANDDFVNAYFDVIHKPFEKDGVDLWWIDWQQGTKTDLAGLDPLWALNHYHYLDHAKNHYRPIILSRYAGVGSHRYPLGFSGDTSITYETLEYIPYFTINATNIGYTWWSHDIGGHHLGFKDDDLFVRFVQFGVFSPINRLHCTIWNTLTKEPWVYANGADKITIEWLQFRHKLIPMLYTSSYLNCYEGNPLIKPMYYKHDIPEAYQYKNEYYFADTLIVMPITTKRDSSLYASVKGFLPKGKYTDIFTNEYYEINEEAKEITFRRDLNSIPVLAKEGTILVLSNNEGNDISNPQSLDVHIYEGNGTYKLYEDNDNGDVAFTTFTSTSSEKGDELIQTLSIHIDDQKNILPKNRKFIVKFKNIKEGQLSGDGQEYLLNIPTFIIETNKDKNDWVVEIVYKKRTHLQKLIDQALTIITKAYENNAYKFFFYNETLAKVKSIDEYKKVVEQSEFSELTKNKLLECL